MWRELRILLRFRLSAGGRDPRRAVTLIVGLALGLVERDGAAVGSSSEQAPSARAASSNGAVARVRRRADSRDPRVVMASL